MTRLMIARGVVVVPTGSRQPLLLDLPYLENNLCVPKQAKIIFDGGNEFLFDTLSGVQGEAGWAELRLIPLG